MTVKVAFLAHPWHFIHSGISELTSLDWHIGDLSLTTFQTEAEVTARPEPLCRSLTHAQCRQRLMVTTISGYTQHAEPSITACQHLAPAAFPASSPPPCNLCSKRQKTNKQTKKPSIHSFLNILCIILLRAFTEGIASPGISFLHLCLLKSRHPAGTMQMLFP